MRTKNFYDVEHARMYLNGCLIRVGNKVAHVDGVGRSDKPDKFQLTYRLVTDPAHPRVTYFPSKEVDFSPFPMGYWTKRVRGTRYTYYLSRNPQRHWKIGPTPRSLLQFDLGGKQGRYSTYGARERTLNIDNVVFSNEFEKMVKGQYGTFARNVKMITDKKDTIAISRRFALLGTGKVYYKFLPDPVGDFDERGIYLCKASEYLQEALQEDMK